MADFVLNLLGLELALLILGVPLGWFVELVREIIRTHRQIASDRSKGEAA